MTSTVSEQFCLKWNNHQHTFVSVFARFLSKEALVDVTLAAEGKHLKAHQMVLSACSEYFEELFTANPCKHPIVILKDVKYEDLKALIQFMYNGEVSVFPGRLSDLLKTAELLKIQSLADVPREDVVESLGDPPSTRGRPRGPKRKLPPPPPDSQQKQGRQYTEEENEYAPGTCYGVKGKPQPPAPTPTGDGRKKRSAVWGYFDKNEETPKKVKCRLCLESYSYSGNTSNMFKHLQSKHSEELGIEGGIITLTHVDNLGEGVASQSPEEENEEGEDVTVNKASIDVEHLVQSSVKEESIILVSQNQEAVQTLATSSFKAATENATFQIGIGSDEDPTDVGFEIPTGPSAPRATPAFPDK